MPTPTTRRPRGSGSISYDKSRDRYRIGWPIRGQAPGSEYLPAGSSRIDADQLLRRRLNERDASGGVKVDRTMSTGAYIETWLAGHVAGKAIGTRIHYADLSRRLIIPALGRIRLADLSTSDIARFRAELIRAGYSRRGADAVVDVLGAALGRAVRDRVLDRNPRAGVDREPKARRIIDPPTPAEQSAILAAVADSPTWSAIYALTIGHGLRSSELLGLRHGDRIGDQLAIVRKREYRTGDTSEEPKDGSVRMVTLQPWVLAELDRLPKATPAAPLFPGGRPGTTIHPHTLLDHIHGLQLELGLRRRYTWHDLRRAYGTRIAARNSTAAVSAAMGHADYRTSLLYIAPAAVVDDWRPSSAAG
jgi:integrase